ncbi:Uncharacterised protein (plasmid) [Legionella adelaidensis]|uniref:Uncharacterized protein n=1 Tax=Legionella adelaidensis TaxID=45056 RepID=A0A0W0R4I8_9GAMM|nr:hypothetical protein [Legionella adelaidensis]KTC65954.1 hypothetical protein Lade_0612 [Legionella adelaidensis]VEH86278.1 Uncharacterised protein [Legionella adelaidensis]
MPSELLARQNIAQAVYMDYVVKLAATQARMTTDLAFDPQGRVLMEVNLQPEDYAQIVAQINVKLGEQFDVSKTGLQDALGRNVSPKATVSLDCADELKSKFIETLRSRLTTAGAKDPQAIIDAYEKQAKGSIIALQQEFHFHLSLATRVYQKAAPQKFDDKEDELAKAHQVAANRVNLLVMDAYAKALQKATKNGVLDLATLNKEFDKARKAILPQAHKILREEIIRHTGVIIDLKAIDKVKRGTDKKDSLKHVAEGLTATSNDLIHTDSKLGLATFISGSENTSHDRAIGKIADRQIATFQFKAGTVGEKTSSRMQTRVASLDVKKGVSAEEAIEDIKNKLKTIATDNNFSNRLETIQGKPKAFVYNLHTAINHTLGDMGGNLQTQGLERILQGVHKYNAEQNKDGVLCFLQNISVNGFGDTLGYDTRNAVRKEATLMAEISMLHTLYDSSPDQQKEMRDVFAKYKKFLDNPQRPAYFSQSEEGQAAIAQIQQIKAQWLAGPVAGDSIVDNAKASLKQLMANNKHFSHENAKLVQTLSILVEEASIAGCKSGNERAQAISGRVVLFDALGSNPDAFGPEGQALAAALKKMASGGDSQTNAVKLNSILHSIYNAHGLQLSSSLVSLLDQGASAKVEASGQGIYSTNKAEENASLMTNLHQSKAGSMQAHKDLIPEMINASEAQPKSVWQRMSGVLGKAGAAILSVVTLGILPLAVKIYSELDNRARKQEQKISEERLVDHYTKMKDSNYAAIEENIHSSDASVLGKLDGVQPALRQAAAHDHDDSDQELKVPLLSETAQVTRRRTPSPALSDASTSTSEDESTVPYTLLK